MSSENVPLMSNIHHTQGITSCSSLCSWKNKLKNCLILCLCTFFIGVLILTVLFQKQSSLNVPTLLMHVNDKKLQNISLLRLILEKQKDPLKDEPESKWALVHIFFDKSKREKAISVGIKALGDLEIYEEGLELIPANSPSFRHYKSFSTNSKARKIARRGFVENQATHYIAELYNFSKDPGRHNVGRGPIIILGDQPLDSICKPKQRYREASGICNNKRNPFNFGAAMTKYRRLLLPDYADGISKPRVDKKGLQLPSAREISLNIHRASYETDSNFTVMLAVFGQFLDHDITATAPTTTQDGDPINCCSLLLKYHPECFPVVISPNDPYYSAFNISCMNFVRSAPAATGYFGPREQLNQATSFIDGSVVYGNSEFKQHQLRTMINGTIRMFITDDGRELLPISTNIDDGCNRADMAREGKYCFESGDDRANENLLLTSMHLLWARHHNYLALNLQKNNPTWNDEILFQEARKILSAQLEHITYNEFLPILIGKHMAAEKGLLPNRNGELDTYNENVDPSIANCFASSSFRFAHTLLPGLFNITKNHSSPEGLELHKMLFNPFYLWLKGSLDSVLMAAINTPVQRVDPFLSIELTEKLFENAKEGTNSICGLDLVSLNIQRGRDHGLPSYSIFRRKCNLPNVDTWEKMSQAVDRASLESMKKIYKSPKDVDVYTGALSEPPLEGAIFGPLLICLVSDQFIRLKIGDAHWYERKFGIQSFRKDQLTEIYKTTLSGIICQNSDSVVQIRTFVMKKNTDPENILLDCQNINSFNFTPWKIERPLSKIPLVSKPVSLIHVITNKSVDLTI